MGFLVRNGTAEETPLLGLQTGTRVPQISDISVDKEDAAIKVRRPWCRAVRKHLTVCMQHSLRHSQATCKTFHWC